MVYGIAVYSEKLGGLSYCYVLLLGLALLCALCALFSHAGILYPSEATRKLRLRAGAKDVADEA
jgi:hypothetical protein